MIRCTCLGIIRERWSAGEGAAGSLWMLSKWMTMILLLDDGP